MEWLLELIFGAIKNKDRVSNVKFTNSQYCCQQGREGREEENYCYDSDNTGQDVSLVSLCPMHFVMCECQKTETQKGALARSNLKMFPNWDQYSASVPAHLPRTDRPLCNMMNIKTGGLLIRRDQSRTEDLYCISIIALSSITLSLSLILTTRD